MAEIRQGALAGDGVPATIAQVIEVVHLYPPIKIKDLAHACFPGFMAGTTGVDDWKNRLQQLHMEFDSRAVVLHDCNVVWRKVSPGITKEIKLYRANDRLAIPKLSADQLSMFFRAIKPHKDDRFRFDKFGRPYSSMEET